jgi:hypothetical protein
MRRGLFVVIVVGLLVSLTVAGASAQRGATLEADIEFTSMGDSEIVRGDDRVIQIVTSGMQASGPYQGYYQDHIANEGYLGTAVSRLTVDFSRPRAGDVKVSGSFVANVELDGDIATSLVWSGQISGIGRCQAESCSLIHSSLELTGSLSDASGQRIVGRMTLATDLAFDRWAVEWVASEENAVATLDFPNLNWYVPDLDSDSSGMIFEYSDTGQTRVTQDRGRRIRTQTTGMEALGYYQDRIANESFLVRQTMTVDLDIAEPDGVVRVVLVEVSGSTEARISDFDSDGTVLTWRGKIAGDGWCSDQTCTTMTLELVMTGSLTGPGGWGGCGNVTMNYSASFDRTSSEWSFEDDRATGHQETKVMPGDNVRWDSLCYIGETEKN